MVQQLLKASYTETVGSETSTFNFYFLGQPALVAGDLSTILGVSEATEAEKARFAPTKVGRLIRKSVLEPIVVSGTVNNTPRRYVLYAARGKKVEALSSLINKTVRGMTIKSVATPTDIRKII